MGRLVNVVIPPLGNPLTYDLPQELAPVVTVGSRVEVPLGRRSASGFVVEKLPDSKSGEPEFEIKQITAAPLTCPSFNREQLQFFEWIADYYRVTLSSVIDVAVPPSAPPRFKRIITLSDSYTAEPKGRLQKEIIKLLRENGAELPFDEISKRFKGATACIKRLAENGAVSITEEELVDFHLPTTRPPAWAKTEIALDEQQQTACDQICSATLARQFKTFLLHGVTGSGKTEVYLEAMQSALAEDRGVLIVVPEIALTPQLIDRFRARLGNEIAILHSGMNKRARWDSWRALLEKRNKIAIGVRSGIFAPVPNLGLIIVDEEHDPSFKQSDGLRYNARDLAVVRGQLMNCPVILGSATPSLESYAHAATGKYTILSLPSQHESGSGLSIEMINMNLLKPWELKSRNISPQLHSEIESALNNNNQTFILYNRRGFASYLHCEECETAVQCPNCSVTFTYHQKDNSLQCHYCSLKLHPPKYCAECSQNQTDTHSSAERPQEPPQLIQRGAGTEKIVEEIQELFPEAVVERLDRDSASNQKEYKKLLERVREGEVDILVGTQMIAKGHDLPGVTLVGVVDCDVGLHMPDFRASERVFQLLTQASGRAGRGGTAGRVVLQTRVPQNPALVFTVGKNFHDFARHELLQRKALNYPPFARMLRIVVSSQDQNQPGELLRSYSALIQNLLSKTGGSAQLLGPTAAPLEKLKTQWRWHLLLKSKSSRTLREIVTMLQQQKLPSRKLKVTFDLDPQEML